MNKRKGDTFTNFGRKILRLKELADKQYLFRHRTSTDVWMPKDLGIKVLRAVMYGKHFSSLLIAIQKPKNSQKAMSI